MEDPSKCDWTMKVLTIQFLECSSLRVYSNAGKVWSSIYETQRN